MSTKERAAASVVHGSIQDVRFPCSRWPVTTVANGALMSNVALLIIVHASGALLLKS